MRLTRAYRTAIFGLMIVAAGWLWSATAAKAQADSYAAIAYSEKTGHYGYGFNYDTRAAAEDRALSECQGDDAKVVVWVRNGWCALAVSDNGPYGWGYGSSEDIAEDFALQKCKEAGGKHARIVVHGYSGD